MKARSLVLDLFGDYLRSRGEVRLRGLIALMSCFEVPEATVRVVVTRLRKEGLLESRRDGRETTYLLTSDAWRLFDEERARIFERSTEPWDGRWHIVIYSVPETERALREQLRKKLSWLGFGPLSPSVWLSPWDRVEEVLASVVDWPSVRLDVFHAYSAGPLADRDMAARSWNLAELNLDYTALLATYKPRLECYRAGALRGPDALVERMKLVYAYRKLPFRDPDLPTELLPDGWAGHAAHEVFQEAHELLREPAEACVDELLRRPHSVNASALYSHAVD